MASSPAASATATPWPGFWSVPANFLLLDEPTNHLDLRAKDVLLEAINSFTGTVIFVSHDRYFIDRLATRVFEVADGAVNVYPGNYEDYLWRKEGGAEALAAATVRCGKLPPRPFSPTPNGHSPRTRSERAGSPRESHQAEADAGPPKFVEEEIPRLEASIGNAEQSWASLVSAEEPPASPASWKTCARSMHRSPASGKS